MVILKSKPYEWEFRGHRDDYYRRADSVTLQRCKALKIPIVGYQLWGNHGYTKIIIEMRFK